MSQATEKTELCYALIAEWFAVAIGGGESKRRGKLTRTRFFPIGRPHGRAMYFLWRLSVANKHPTKSEYWFDCTVGDIADIALKNIDDGPEFADLLAVFIELSVYYGTAETRKDSPFQIHDDVQPLLVELEKLGYVRRLDGGFAWTDRVRSVMERIYNNEFDDDPAETRSEQEVRSVIERLSSSELQELNALSGNKVKFIMKFIELAGLPKSSLTAGFFAFEHCVFPDMHLKRRDLPKPFRYIGVDN